jgi:hypothetical protein
VIEQSIWDYYCSVIKQYGSIVALEKTKAFMKKNSDIEILKMYDTSATIKYKFDKAMPPMSFEIISSCKPPLTEEEKKKQAEEWADRERIGCEEDLKNNRLISFTFKSEGVSSNAQIEIRQIMTIMDKKDLTNDVKKRQLEDISSYEGARLILYNYDDVEWKSNK